MTPLDPDPLHVDDDRIPSSKPYRLVPDSPRRGCGGCSIFAFLILASLVFVGSAAPRAASEPVAAAGELRAVQGQPGAPLAATATPPTSVGSSVRPATRVQFDPGSGAPQPAAASAVIPMPAQDASAVTWEGTLAYALPSYGPRYLAIRQPRGTRVVVCGPSDCVTRISTDFGPSAEMARQGRIADLSAVDWLAVCGVPLSFGLCPGIVTLAGLPATDQ